MCEQVPREAGQATRTTSERRCNTDPTTIY
jgi:hypothetical protein